MRQTASAEMLLMYCYNCSSDWESGPCLVVDLCAKEHATYPGVLQQQGQQGLVQLIRWVLAAWYCRV